MNVLITGCLRTFAAILETSSIVYYRPLLDLQQRKHIESDKILVYAAAELNPILRINLLRFKN